MKNPVLLEAGVFLGGSMYRWLDGEPSVRVVGIDPFGNVSAYVAGLVARDIRKAAYRTGLAQLAAPSGSYDTCVATLWRFRERACLVILINTASELSISTSHDPKVANLSVLYGCDWLASFGAL